MELLCSVSGDPAPAIWWRENAAFSELRGELGDLKAVLYAVRVADAGIYACHTENAAASIEQRVRLEVVPSSPGTPPVIVRPNRAVHW